MTDDQDPKRPTAEQLMHQQLDHLEEILAEREAAKASPESVSVPRQRTWLDWICYIPSALIYVWLVDVAHHVLRDNWPTVNPALLWTAAAIAAAIVGYGLWKLVELDRRRFPGRYR